MKSNKLPKTEETGKSPPHIASQKGYYVLWQRVVSKGVKFYLTALLSNATRLLSESGVFIYNVSWKAPITSYLTLRLAELSITRATSCKVVGLLYLCSRQRPPWTSPPQVFTSVHLLKKFVGSRFTISSPRFQNNWVKIHRRKKRERSRFTKVKFLLRSRFTSLPKKLASYLAKISA